jgi:hypothetical protein
MSLNGTALAADTADDESVYAEIVEFVEGRNWYDNLVDIVYADDDNELYAIFNNGSTAIIDGDEPEISIEPTNWGGNAAKVTKVLIGTDVYLTKTATGS